MLCGPGSTGTPPFGRPERGSTSRGALAGLSVPEEQRDEIRQRSCCRSESSLLALPLFRHSQEGVFEEEQKGYANKRFWLLFWLYDYRKEAWKRDDESGKWDIYARSRMLWHVMHYERVNDHKTLDLFPGITYDSNPGERKVFSILWRLFRYDWEKDRGTKLHLFFIPF